MSRVPGNPCEQSELVSAYAVHALPAAEMPGFEAHLSSCDCAAERE